MNRKQFSEALALVATSVDKPVSREQAEVFWAALGDLPLETFRLACTAFVATNRSHNGFKALPTPGDLRALAVEAIQRQVAMSAADAWAIARRAANAIDPDVTGPYWRAGREWPSMKVAYLADLPLLVGKAVRQIGIDSISTGKESVVFAQFRAAYEQNVAQLRSLAMLPTALREQIEQVRGTLPAGVAGAVAQIGTEK